ncbi:DUF6232 family protein [Actinoplanes sp. NPDC051343]|uniref:DUF6232 family protein n=1 Tax=Actinoplanes sp. NPDC051343 TaxID=3363906 RepID=UPI0037AEE8B7
MPVFYRGRRALITQHVFETESVGRLQYAIKDLADVHIVRLDPEAVRGAYVLGLSALAAAFLVVPIVGPASKVVAGVAAAVLLAGSATSARRRLPVRWELVATYEGRRVTLFVSGDQTEFDQVCRGLLRALEQQNRVL